MSLNFLLPIGSIVTDFLSTLTSWVNGLITLLLSILSQVVDIFYDGTAETLTVYGVLALFGLGWALIKFGIGFISRMIRR